MPRAGDKRKTPSPARGGKAVKHAGTTPSTLVRAATVIQRFMRRSKDFTTRRIVELFCTGGPSIQRVKSISFEALVVFLREKNIIAVSKACLQRIHCLCIRRHGTPCRSLTPEIVNVRVFLAAFMIAYRPTHVFESMGELEQSLLESAGPLIEALEGICGSLRGQGFASVPSTLTVGFTPMLFEFLKRFKAWKIPDEAKLITRIKHALLALYQAEALLGEDSANLRVEFTTQIERLRSKLAQIAGPDALAQFDAQRLSGTDGCSGSGGGGGGGDDEGGAYAALPGRMTNEQLAHELLIDPTFQLNEDGGCSAENPVFHRIRESFHTAFWDSLVSDLELSRPCYVRVLRVLAEIRDGVNDLAGSRDNGGIAEVVDIDLIQQQADRGIYEWGSCMGLVSSILRVVQQVQAPKRDEETKAKWSSIHGDMQAATVADQPRVFCRALEFLLDRVNAMRIDAANSRLRLIAPVIKDHGIDYERGKMQDKIKDGSLTLERTEAWIAKTLRVGVAAGTVDSRGLIEGKSPAFIQVHSDAMLYLVADYAPLKHETCPETLLLDVHRLGLLKAEFQNIVLAASMLVTVAHALKDVPKAVVEICNKELKVDDFIDVLGADDALKRKLLQCASPSDPVHQLFAQRVRTFWAQGGQFAAKSLVPRIEKAAAQLRAITTVNRLVHLTHYNRIIGEEACKIFQ